MIRSEALKLAIAIAEEVTGSNGLTSPERVAASVSLGELWLGIADRLPTEAPVSQVITDIPLEEGDEERIVAQCGHGITAVLVSGLWYHVGHMSVCDDPPISKGKDR